MKRYLLGCLIISGLIMFPMFLYPQESPSSQTDTQKFALIIGNAEYSGLTPLANPVNDANDIAEVLEQLGFTVDKILNGNMNQMENAVLRLKDRLSNAENAYGFFFYAGHGVQSGGENFLIPVDANIPGENYLRNRAVSVQTVLDDLNDARNSLNVVVLDACRDNPFGWSRSGTRGLAIVSRQPADSIIVYATSAGQRASDGIGRNGLFTGQLLNHLATPGLEVKDIFNRTGADVAQVSRNEQIPAIYSQFFGTAYLGVTPEGALAAAYVPGTVVRPEPLLPPAARKKESRTFSDETRLWSAGASLGSALQVPWLIATVRGTAAPLPYLFLELGLDIGFLSAETDVTYNSFFPFGHAAFYYPAFEWAGAYIGAGGGYLTANYDFKQEGSVKVTKFSTDIIAGIIVLDMIDVSYTLRTDFDRISSKLSLGYLYRFRQR